MEVVADDDMIIEIVKIYLGLPSDRKEMLVEMAIAITEEVLEGEV